MVRWSKKLTHILVCCIEELKSLETINISINKLTTLPTSLNKLSRLKLLNCSYNNIIDLPEEIKLVSLLEFDISNITCYTTSSSNQTITNTTLRIVCSDITSSKNKMKDELTIQYNRFIENLETYQ